MTPKSLLMLMLRRVEPDSLSQRRYRRIAHAFLAGVVGKCINLLALLISVPLTLGYLGAERYGIWIAMTSLLSWLAVADIGLGNGLMNLLADAKGRERIDLAPSYVATTFWGLTLIATVVAVVSIPVCERVDWSYLLNISDPEVARETRAAILVALLCFALSLPLSIVAKVYIAYQEGALANAWIALGSVLGLLAIVVVTRGHGGLVALTTVVLGTQTLVALASALYLFGYRHPALKPSWRRVNSATFRSIFGVGTLFLLSQIQSVLVFQSDVLIISHFLGPAQVTPYSVTGRLFAYVNVPLQLLTPYFLAAVGEAHGRGDAGWVRVAFLRLLFGSLGCAVPLILVLSVWYRPIIHAWAGTQAVPGQELVVWMALWSLVLAVTTPMFVVLTATRNFARMVIFAYIAAGLNVLLSIILVQRVGVVGVCAATVIANASCCLAPYIVETARFFRRSPLATGSAMARS